MRGNRWLMMLGGCLLAGSAASADELGYVDCASHNDTTPVFAKARKSQDIVANVPCGERFKVLVYGFVFSEIQTNDGKVGFIYSNVMSADRSGGTLQSRASSAATPSLSAASDKTKIYAEPKDTAAPAKSQVVPAPVTSAAAAPAPAVSSPTSSNAPTVNEAGVRGAMIDGQANPAPAQPKVVEAPPTLPGPESVLKATSGKASSADAPASGANAVPAPAVTPAPAPQPAAADAPAPAAPTATPATTPAPTETAQPAAPTAAPDAVVTDLVPKVDAAPATDGAQPQPDAQPQPEAAPAPVEPVKPEKTHEKRWERPNYGAKSASLLELFGGFAFARLNSSGSYTNGLSYPGAMGSFGVNVKPWLQIAGDTSYNFQNSNGVKNILYGNHYGPRVFMRGRTRWNLAPFGEVLFGGSRADTTVPSTPGYPGYTVSTNCFSIKAGGGVDVHPTKMFSIRLIDVDYYRTSFGTNQTQTNYWISTGIVIKLMRGWWE